MTTQYKSLKDLPREHQMAPGTAMCAGCGGLEVIKLIYDLLGERTVFVNAAGCMTLLAIYPYSPFPGSWMYTAMASAPAGAQGIRDALDVLGRKGRLPAGQELNVVVLSGDGASNGIAMSATSAALYRGLDFYYVCYDNEGFGNTGQQTSEATPLGARTATDPLGAGYAGRKKDLFAIWCAHRPAYAATVAAAEPVDLARKVEKARELKGPKLFLALAPCPPGWHFDARETVEIGKLAVKTGLWPLKEYTEGRIVHTRPPRPRGERPPVETCLERQGRYAHLFTPERNEPVLGAIQAQVDDYWAQVA